MAVRDDGTMDGTAPGTNHEIKPEDKVEYPSIKEEEVKMRQRSKSGRGKYGTAKKDVRGAHRLIVHKRKDWRFLTARLRSGAWAVNCVGCSGLVPASLHWGRLGALLMRLVYAMVTGDC